MSLDTLKIIALLAAQDAYFGVLDFDAISTRTGIERASVRNTCRRLKRDGVADFQRGCWTEDGRPAGSGYCISREARAILVNAEAGLCLP